jgi:large repetitive protein
VAVNDPFPVTNEDVATTTNVLVNDSDPDGDPLTIISVTTPASGTTAIISNRIIYTPNMNYYGTDIFTYTISDGTLTDTARVTMTVNGINDAPVATNAAASTAEDSSENVIIIPDFASDVEGPLTLLSVGTPTLGTVTYNTSVIAYTPLANLNGTDIFTYTVTDGMLTATAAVTVTIFAANDPPVAVDDVYTTSVSGSPLSVTAPGVLGNDSDVDGDPLTAMLVTSPAAVTLIFSNDGSFTYTPTMTGTYSFTYQAADGAVSSVAAVTIDVSAP